jgi:hypothetical protein
MPLLSHAVMLLTGCGIGALLVLTLRSRCGAGAPHNTPAWRLAHEHLEYAQQHAQAAGAPRGRVGWAVEGASSKRGVGLLFFAYGGTKQLGRFLAEASTAAASFRAHNPNLSIAIVTNNQTVDPHVFDVHIAPRPDLLFAGNIMRNDNIPRQWLTRLYYMAHSPYAIT